MRVRTSYLGLHAVPPEHRTDRDAYVDLAIDEILPAAHAEGLVDAVDAYLRAHRLLRRARSRGCSTRRRALGLPVKLHADQLSDGGGAAPGRALRRAVGRPHRAHQRGGHRRHGRAGVVAVLLPGAF